MHANAPDMRARLLQCAHRHCATQHTAPIRAALQIHFLLMPSLPFPRMPFSVPQTRHVQVGNSKVPYKLCQDACPRPIITKHPSALLSPADYLHTHFQFTPRQQLCHHDHSTTLPADIRRNAPEPIAAAGALHFRLGVPSWEGIYARSIICYAVAT